MISSDSRMEKREYLFRENVLIKYKFLYRDYVKINFDGLFKNDRVSIIYII